MTTFGSRLSTCYQSYKKSACWPTVLIVQGNHGEFLPFKGGPAGLCHIYFAFQVCAAYIIYMKTLAPKFQGLGRRLVFALVSWTCLLDRLPRKGVPWRDRAWHFAGLTFSPHFAEISSDFDVRWCELDGRTATCFGRPAFAYVRGTKKQDVGEAWKRAEEIEPMWVLLCNVECECLKMQRF